MKEIKKTEMSVKDFRDKGILLFGQDPLKWKFVCGLCHNVQTVENIPEIFAQFSYLKCQKHGCKGESKNLENSVTIIEEDGRRIKVFNFYVLTNK